jgi:hypothetical protein
MMSTITMSMLLFGTLKTSLFAPVTSPPPPIFPKPVFQTVGEHSRWPFQ